METTWWDKHFLRMAREAATMSKDPSTKVGCVITQERRVVSTGYNGFPSRLNDDDRLHDRDAKLKLIVHAEMNALIFAGREACGGTLHMWGFAGAPCTNCCKHLIAAGIDRVVVAGPPVPERWQASLEDSAEMLGEAGIELAIYHGGIEA